MTIASGIPRQMHQVHPLVHLKFVSTHLAIHHHTQPDAIIIRATAVAFGLSAMSLVTTLAEEHLSVA